MRLETLQRAILAAAILGVAAVTLAQIPVPPLPGLHVEITTGRPPAMRHEHRGHSPGAGYVWVNGFWHWDGGRWDWVPGRWDRPPVAEAYWIAPRYVHAERGYIYEPGHWSNQTVIVGDDIRAHHAWRNHEREHERELEREHDHNCYRDRDQR